MEDVRTNTGMVEGLERTELSHEGMVQDSIKSDAKYATEGNALTNKRKRSSIDENLKGEGMEFFVLECQKELNELFEFYEEVSSYTLHLEEGQFSSLNFAVACLLEESSLPFSKAVEEIYGKLKAWEGNLGITLASVRSAVLFVGQRTMYGVMNEDVDVLEDESMKCLWCWETRDFKLLPKNQRGFFNARRVIRKKIHERVSSLSKIIVVALSMTQTNKSYRSDIIKAYQRLGRTLNVTEIRSLAEKLMQRSSTEMAEKEAKLKEKELIKTFEKNKQSAEKERKIIDREIQKEKLQAEKELKKVHEEAAKEEKRREKEEAELSKQIKKQEEQAKRDQWRQAKESAELRKQLTIQKQAKIMERFLNCNKVKNSVLSTGEAPKIEEPCNSKGLVDTVTCLMDQALSQQESLPLDDLCRMHIVGWHKARSSNKFNRWGMRQKPRVSLFPELKLNGSSSEIEPFARGVAVPEKDLANSKLNCSTEPTFSNHLSEHAVIVSKCNARCEIGDNMQSCYKSIRKLLQFDKSNRPAYYGTWNRKSGSVGPRHPFEKDPDLDYEFESDEEWVEEEPGESLSECEKDNEDELLDNEHLKADDENESEDSFLVPDGYLSENEGVQFDSTSDGKEDESGSSTYSQMDNENEEPRAFFQKQKYLNTLTEQALRKCHPLIITNLMHEKSASINIEDLVGTAKLEQICLQLLCIRACPGGLAVDISIDQPSNKDHTFSLSQGKDLSTSATATVVPHSDLPEFIRAIQSYPNSINKVVGSLQQKFSNISKSQIRNTIRDISEFVDNRWQVKKEVLDRHALSISPDKCSHRPKGIAIFFSKRCLPPREETMKIQEP